MPPRRAFFNDEYQILRIRELIRTQNLKDGIRDNHQSTPEDTFQSDVEVTKPAGARTPVEDMLNSSSASINSLSRSNSHESMEVVEEINEPSQRNGRSPANSDHSPMANGHAKRRRSLSPSRSRHSRDFRHHNGHSHSSSRRREDFDSHHYRDRKRRMNSRDDKYSSKHRRRDFSISPDRTKSSYRSSRKRSVSSSSTKSGSTDSYRNRPKRAYNNRERSPSKTRRSDSRSEKLSEVNQPAEPINLCVQPPPAPYDLSLPFSAAFPPPFFPHFFPAPPIVAEPNATDSIPTIAEDAPVRLKPVQRELGPYFVMNKSDRVEFFKQMRMAGYYNEHGIFIIPTLRIYEENLCSFLVTEFFVELDNLEEPTPVNPQITKIEQIKEQLKNDLLSSLKASMCQKIETLLYKEVDRLHAEYEVKQKQLDEEKSKMKRPETKQIFDFEEQFNSGMGTRSVFGSNRMMQFNRNIFATKKIPKKSAEIVHKKQEKSVHHKKSVDLKAIKKEIEKQLKVDSPSSSYKSPSPAIRSGSRASTMSSVKKSPHTPSAQSVSSTSSRDSSLSSSASNVSSASDNEDLRPRKISSSTSSKASVSQPTSPKAANMEFAEDDEIDNLQITQSRTMRKVDYCEDNSSESEAAGSDWAEDFGMGNEQKEGKKSFKKHKQRPKESVSDSDESNKTKEQPKKAKPPKPVVIKEETPRVCQSWRAASIRS